MPEQKGVLDQSAVGDTTESKEGRLSVLLGKVNVSLPTSTVSIDQIADADKGAIVTAALRVFVDAIAELQTPLDKIDKTLLDGLVAKIDQKLSEQLDEIMHAAAFQKMESAWRGLKFLVDRTDFRRNVRIELLDVSKDALRESFEDSPELIQSPLYRQVYSGAYDQPGADPYAAMISNYEFENSPAGHYAAAGSRESGFLSALPVHRIDRAKVLREELNGGVEEDPGPEGLDGHGRICQVALLPRDPKTPGISVLPSRGSWCACHMDLTPSLSKDSTTPRTSKVRTTKNTSGQTRVMPSRATWSVPS